MTNVFFQRKIYNQLKKHIENKQITVLTGLRRVGKTTVIKHLLSEIKSDNKMYFDLQQINNRELFSEKNFDNIVLRLKQLGLNIDKKMYIAIDEIQLFPEISGVLKYLYDSYDIKFIATGSSSYYLKNLFGESLSGRKRIFELFPLDFGEYLTFKQVSWSEMKFVDKKFDVHEYNRLGVLYEDFLKYGGFPEVVLMTSDEDKKYMLNDIISSYVNIDIKSLVDFRESSDVYNLIKMLAARVGTRLDYSKLSRLTGMTRVTVMNYVALFEKTYLIFLIPVHTNNLDREIVKAKKIYFADNGLVDILADVSGGVKFENAILNQLRHKGDLRYYALKTGQEIDFIFDGKFALEVKENPTSTDLTVLKNLAKMARVKNLRLIGRFNSPQFGDYIWGGDVK